MKNKSKAVIYARFSSGLQREESIDAQVRACRYFAQKQNMNIVKIYSDRAKSGTSVKGREEFLQMISDAENGDFDVVLVHKLNRFGRDGLDTLQYKKVLEQSGVSLISVTENLDNTPEGRLMLMVITGMNEFYSANLCSEVMKGLKENAYNGKHTGGIPPLGYDVDPVTKELVLNEQESQAVSIIFKKYLEGSGYTEILDTLNQRGYKTKRGMAFGKGSLHEILKNEKYTGSYIFNKSAAKDSSGKFNRHRYKEEDDIIRVENAIPQIVSKEDFDEVQRKMELRRHKSARYTAKEQYLLTGKIVCGECGSSFTGISRKERPGHPQYVSYRCSRKNGKNKCSNTGIRREEIEKIVLARLAEFIFDGTLLPKLLEEYKSYKNNADSEAVREIERADKRLRAINREIANIVSVIAKTGSQALNDKLTELESEKKTLLSLLESRKIEADKTGIAMKELRIHFRRAKQMFTNGTLSTGRKLIDKYIDKIVMYKDHIEIRFNIGVQAPPDPNGSGGSLFERLLTVRQNRKTEKDGTEF
jgi:site-specific DNA recombinase